MILNRSSYKIGIGTCDFFDLLNDLYFCLVHLSDVDFQKLIFSNSIQPFALDV